MSLDPIVVNVKPPRTPFRLPSIPGMSPRATKILTAVAAIVISISMALFAVASVATNNNKFKQSHGISSPTDVEQANGTDKSVAALPGGGVATGVGGTTGTNAPVVTLTAQPASVSRGSKTHLKWSVSNNPKSCTASDDWNGDRKPSGEQDTESLTIVQTYIFTLTCKTATGTGFASVSVGVIDQGGSGDINTRPTVHLAANPSSVYVGQDTTLTWEATNDPTTCTASGSWKGAKSNTGTESTGALTATKSYTYTLTCSNKVGSGFATISVSAVDLPPDIPVVSLSITPAVPITPGGSITLDWTSANSPSSCNATDDWSGSKSGSGSATIGPLTTVKTYKYTLTCNNSSGSSFDSVTIDVLPNPPTVSLTVNPASMNIGGSATVNWSATNSPTSCTASGGTGGWAGARTSSGSLSTGAINAAGTVYFSLSCKNAGGTGFANNIPLNVTLPSPPVVSISLNPISITAGSSSTITWSATNSPTSCTASGGTGGWAASRPSSGTFGTGTIATAGTYNYVLSCTNAGGTGQASASLSVATGGPAAAPVVSISVSPTSIGSGSSATVSWTATNSPTSCTASGGTGSWAGAKNASGSVSTGVITTAGTYGYKIACTNSKGTSPTANANLTVIAVPVVTISASPSTITTGSNTTISWTTTGAPTSCTASGNSYWSGSKGTNASNSQQAGPITTAGTYTFSMTCSNSGGASQLVSTSITVNNAVYCSGSTPCYGPKDLATHTAINNCWGYNLTQVFDITTLNNNYHKSGKPKANLFPNATSPMCGNVNIGPYLSGTSLSGVGSHNHLSSTKNNTNTTFTGFRAGYYDAAKP